MTSYERHDRAAELVPRFRLVHDVPLKASNAALRGNVIAYWAMGADRIQHLSGVRDVRVSPRNGSHRMRGGRARWKMENDTFKTLKKPGDNFEHHDGHGEQHLSVVLAVVMLLAFLVAQTQQLCCALCRAVWTKMGSKRLFGERRRALFYDYRLDAMRALFEALLDGVEKSYPILSSDTS